MLTMLDDLTQELDFGIDWELANEDAERWARQYGYALVNRLNNTTRRRLAAEIAEWTQNSETINQLAARLAGLFDARRAKTIAVTEVTRAYAQGNQAAWARSKVIDAKRWNTANDELVCPICGPLNGRIVPLTGTFDGIDNPPAHPNCRCWITPVVMEAEDVAPASTSVPAWAPQLDRSQAEQWVVGSVITDDVYHSTSTISASSIKRAGFKRFGFDLERTKFGRVWGDGVYITPSEDVADVYANWISQGGSNSAKLKLKVNLQNPFTYVFETGITSDPKGTAAMRAWTDIVNRVNPNLLDDRSFFSWMNEAGPRTASGQLDISGTLTKILTDAGYDGLIIREPGFSVSVGGDQIVVFDPQKVVVINE